VHDQKIEPPTEKDIENIAMGVVHAGQVIEQALDEDLDGTHQDLELIQRVLDQGLVEPEATYTLQAFGLAFGRVFLNEFPDYDWWMVEDEHGRDPAIRYKETSLLVFPMTMISKRIEDGEPFDVSELFDGLAKQLAELIQEGVYGE
jgi:Domain of unknown function (DUF3806)